MGKSTCFSSDNSSKSEASKVEKSRAGGGIDRDFDSSSFEMPITPSPNSKCSSFVNALWPLPFPPTTISVSPTRPSSVLSDPSCAVIDATRPEYSNERMTLLDQSSPFSLTVSLEVAKRIYDGCINKGEIKKSKVRKTEVVNGISKEDEVYIMSKKRNNPMRSSTPKSGADTGTKRKRCRSTYGQNVLQRGNAYQTTFYEKGEAAPVFRQQEIVSPQHSDRAVIKNTVLFPAFNLSYPDHVSSTDATCIHAHNKSSEEQFEQIVVSSKLKFSNSKNKKALDSQSIIGKWKKVKASTLKYLNCLDKNHLEKIASIVDIEVDWTNTDGTDTNSVMIERVKEWITKDMDRYFSESIDDAVDGKVRKLKIEKLRNIIKEIKSSKEKRSDKVGSDQTVRYYPPHQTNQSHVTHDLKQINMQSSIAYSDKSCVATPMLFATPPSLATTVIQTYTSSETQSFTGDTLQI